jgi:sugar phosphate isomerase/epimerase
MPYRARMRVDQIALQLWTVRDLTASDVPGTLHAVHEAGYRTVEVAGLPETAPDELRRLLDEAGLTVAAAHEGIAGLRLDPDAIAAKLTTIGCPRIIVPWLPVEDRMTHSDVRRFALELGDLARRFAERDIRLGYHNHDFEFEALDGTTTWDILLAELPPDVELELDVYWAAHAGRDPVSLIQAAPDRIRLLHMKDRSAGQEPRDLPAGEGTLDFPAIVAAARAAGVEWYVAEQDEPRVILDDIASAYRYLATLADEV